MYWEQNTQLQTNYIYLNQKLLYIQYQSTLRKMWSCTNHQLDKGCIDMTLLLKSKNLDLCRSQILILGLGTMSLLGKTRKRANLLQELYLKYNFVAIN